MQLLVDILLSNGNELNLNLQKFARQAILQFIKCC